MPSLTRHQRSQRVTDTALGVIGALASAATAQLWADDGPTVQSLSSSPGVVLGVLVAATAALLASIVARWAIHRIPRWVALGAVAATTLSLAGMLAVLAIAIAGGGGVVLVQLMLMTGFTAGFLAALISARRRRLDT